MRTVIIDPQTYVAPRVESREQDGRTSRRALCGHDVWVSEHGLKRVAAGLKLVCGPCAKEAMGADRIITVGEEGW